MIILLSGPDDYRREERKKFYIQEFRKKHGALGVERFSLQKEGDLERVEEFSRGRSLFSTHRMAVLENAFDMKTKEYVEILEMFTRTGPETTLLLSEDNDSPDEFGILNGSKIIRERFETLSGVLLSQFAAKRAAEFSATLTPAAAAFLAEVYEGDTWALMTELQKISSSGRAVIDRKDLEHLDLEVAPDFWALLYGLKAQNVRTRVATLEKILAYGESPAKVFNIVSYQLPEKLALSARCDVLIKSGKLDYEEALLSLSLE